MRLMNVGFIVALLLASLAWFAFAEDASTTAPEDIQGSFPLAGIQIALPGEFLRQQPNGQFELLRAIAKEGRYPMKSITLSAYMLNEEATLQEFAESMMNNLRGNLALRRLRLLKRTPMRVAGRGGLAQTYSYTYRGEGFTTASVIFDRKLEPKGQRICYVLSVESEDDQISTLLPLLGRLVPSVKFTPEPPVGEISIGTLGPVTPDYRLGYALQLPSEWFLELRGSGLLGGLTDYFRGGDVMPRVQVIVQEADIISNAESVGESLMIKARRIAETNKINSEIAYQGPATMAGEKAYDYVMLQHPPAVKTQPSEGAMQNFQGGPTEIVHASMMIGQRTCCVVGPDGRKRSYTLVIAYPGENIESIRKVMDKVAGSFQAMKAPEGSSGAESRPAPTSQPINIGVPLIPE